MDEHNTGKDYSRPIKIAVPLLAGIVFLIWLIATPSGLLGKADAVGYAVCHRIGSHSFHLADRQLPLCARCSGMHLGALLGMVYQLHMGKRGGMPARKFLVVFAVALLAFAFDGANSYLTLGDETGNAIPFLASIEPLYEPQNWLRALTGILLGLGIAAILFPVFNQTLWRDWRAERALTSWKQLLTLLLSGLVLEAMILSENVLLLYPLAILSAFNVVLVLAIIYTIVWTMILKRENVFVKIRQIWVLLLLGSTTAILQIGLMDYGRFLLTGTWGGFFT